MCGLGERRDNVTVSVNASPTNLLEPGFTDFLRELLTRHGLPPEALVLEVTETSLIANLEGTKRVVEELRDLGVIVSIDDFGAGFTSLAYLSDLAVGRAKLDGVFITDLASGDRERDIELVRATIELGHAMGLRVVAECIENKRHSRPALRARVRPRQGYSIGRPMPGEGIFPRSDRAERIGRRSHRIGTSPRQWSGSWASATPTGHHHHDRSASYERLRIIRTSSSRW